MSRELETAQRRLASIRSTEDDLSETLETVSSALGDAVETRDEALSTTEALARKVELLEEDMRKGRERRERVFSKLEDAVQTGLGAMEGMFKRAGLNVESLIDAVRREYSGAGGPEIPVDDAALIVDDGLESERMQAMLVDLERMGLMRIAAEKLPFAHPVRASYRYTSGFGVRRDPKNGRRRQHNGADFASRTGTPIYATGEGIVVEAGWHAGYGRMVEIDHGFGYTTLYAHMRKLRVRKGQRVARGDRIGDMGSSGRSTGTHLHYEIRVGGRPVNPVKYIEAARNVL
jgi:murein DD-endopeptidase MepM/ murein hydrolase activator NlpD